MAYDKYNKYNNKNKKSNKKKTNKKTSSYKKTNFSKKQYNIIKNIASKVSQNNNNVEWKQLVCDYTKTLKIINGNNTSTESKDNPSNYNFIFKPITQLGLDSQSQLINYSSGKFVITSNDILDSDDDTTQTILGRRINIKSIYVKGYIKYTIDNTIKTPQSAGFIIYKQKYNKDADKVINTGNKENYETIPNIQDMYKEPITPTTTAGVLNMRYNALTNPLKKREFIPLMKFTKTINKYDTDMTEYNFKVSKFYKFKNGLPVKWSDDAAGGINNAYNIKLSEINNLYFVPWFSYIPETDKNPNWEMNLKIYVNYTDV